MTLKLAKRLQERQAGKVSLKSLGKVFLGKRVNSRLVETIFLNNTNENVLGKVRDYLVKRVVAKDKRALNILLCASDEGLNKNLKSRVNAVLGLRNLSFKSELSVLPSLLRAVNDSNAEVRGNAVVGLRVLAKKGETGVLLGLLRAVSDSDAIVRLHAFSGLKSLAKLGNKQAQEKLNQIGDW